MGGFSCGQELKHLYKALGENFTAVKLSEHAQVFIQKLVFWVTIFTRSAKINGYINESPRQNSTFSLMNLEHFVSNFNGISLPEFLRFSLRTPNLIICKIKWLLQELFWLKILVSSYCLLNSRNLTQICL